MITTTIVHAQLIRNAHLEDLKLAIKATDNGFEIFKDDGNINHTRLTSDEEGNVSIPFPYVRNSKVKYRIENGCIIGTKDTEIKLVMDKNELVQLELF